MTREVSPLVTTQPRPLALAQILYFFRSAFSAVSKKLLVHLFRNGRPGPLSV
jgi:hypothetical protein